MLLNALRERLASPRASYQLCMLAIAAGFSAALVIILFRLAFEQLQLLWLTDLNDFSSLTWQTRLLMPIAAVIVILMFAYITGFKYYRMGVPFVIHRVKRHYGHIPLPTSINQFFGGMIALACGFGVGKEGPSVHLGAAGSGFIGQWLKLPLNSIRILAGCGIAAGISACFNTPFAAVIFVMEVVLREYKIHIFIPVMLAAACGSLATQWVFGDGHELKFLVFTQMSAWYYAYLIPCGALLGALAALFNHQLMALIRTFGQMNMTIRLLLAGLLTGLLGVCVPQAMGAGLEPLAPLIAQPEQIMPLIILLVVKISMTLIAISLGVPGGIIGPVFSFGMIAGVILLYPLTLVLPEASSNSGNFALLGMAGMLAAVLHAPLSALSAVMELSLTPEVILPAMLVIVPAYITSVQLFKNRSIFLQQLDYQKLEYTASSLRETLQRHGVLSAMEKDFSIITDISNEDTFRQHKSSHEPQQILAKPHSLGTQYQWIERTPNPNQSDNPMLRYHTMPALDHQATLADAYEQLQVKRQGAVYIYQANPENIVGVLRWSTIRGFLTEQRY